MRTTWIAVGTVMGLATLGVACSPKDNVGRETASAGATGITGGSATTVTTSGGGTSDGGLTSSGGGTTTSGGGTSGGGGPNTSTSGGGTTDGGIKFDIGGGLDIPGVTDTGNPTGCKKIDFLFVVDNSGSMQDEQTNLINSFPGFISTIQNTVMADDYHIMAVDTDAAGGGSCLQSTTTNDCNSWCTGCLAQGCQCICNNVACPVPPAGDCEDVLGAGQTSTPGGQDCGFTSGQRYMLDSQPNLTQTFQCAAEVGTGGDGNERPMDAAIEAITTLNPAGECNEGFLRDDAILVVTVISDEEDIQKSAGNPPDWVNAMVAAKNNDEKAIVALAVVGDTDLPNATCQALAGNDGADASPRLRQWAESFTFGQWGSICAADYTPFFEQAVSVIDSACDDFVPPG